MGETNFLAARFLDNSLQKSDTSADIAGAASHKSCTTARIDSGLPQYNHGATALGLAGEDNFIGPRQMLPQPEKVIRNE